MSDFQVVTLKDKKIQYEVLCKPGTVLKYREGKISADDVLFADGIFTNHKKGDKAKQEELKATFGTDNVKECIKQVLDKGEYHLSTQERKEKVEKRRREIINYIHKYYTDPRTKTPHPVTRIEAAMDSIKYNVDPFVPVEKQVQDIVKMMVEIIPLKKSEVEADLKIKHALLGQALATVKKWCNIQNESYSSSGASFRVSIVPGDYDIFIKEMENITKGEYELEVHGAPSKEAGAAATAPKGGWKGKPKEDKKATGGDTKKKGGK